MHNPANCIIINPKQTFFTSNQATKSSILVKSGRFLLTFSDNKAGAPGRGTSHENKTDGRQEEWRRKTFLKRS